MPRIKSADPFSDTCQLCDCDIAKGENYYTVVIKNKEKHICQKCRDRLDAEGRIDPKAPIIFSQSQ